MNEVEIVKKIVDDIILAEWHQSIYWSVENDDDKDIKKRKIFTDLVESILTEYKRLSPMNDMSNEARNIWNG